MLPALALAGIALTAIKLDPRLVVGLLTLSTLIYARRTGISLKLRNVTEEESYLNAYLFSTFLAVLSCFGLSRDVVFASIFLVLVHNFRKNALWDIAIYTTAALFYFLSYHAINGIGIKPAQVFFLSLSGGLTAALVESVDTNADKRLTLLIALSTVFTIFKMYIPSASMPSLTFAFLFSFLVSLLALYAKVADESGLMSATIVGTTLILFTDIRFFAVILLFYALGSVITKYKYSVKLEKGIAEQAGGARGYANVFGNSLAPLFFAIQYGVSGESTFAAAFVTAVAAALADTMASEIGKAEEKVYLITNLDRVEPGTSGGVSFKGELAALVGCIITALLAYTLGIAQSNTLFFIVLSSFAGVHIDSLLGATLEKKGYLTNSAVNFLGTLSAGIICVLLLLQPL
ncbi:MAG: TIGR00297 family protein [Archaeoglobus sp.]|uniref:TIGR00297 family protein n=1 Tax=Archaeoglobus sp. TaxID=1872626 RepID=UPI001D765A66|nr:TIGR00297 family protein [Archaeoglobus sp.]MBO8179661.1 TIGR00297 family protein [Archaeoglobus sp.]